VVIELLSGINAGSAAGIKWISSYTLSHRIESLEGP